MDIDMAISARASRKLRESLGEETAHDLVTWMGKMEKRLSELQNVVEAWKVATDSRLAAVEARMDLRFVEQQRSMDAGFAEMRQGMAAMEIRFERRFGDLIKWSFVFWTGMFVGLIVPIIGLWFR